MSNAGRKAKYPTELLHNKLIEYINKNPNKNIKISDLAKSTDIPFHVWRDNKEIRATINKVNHPQIILDTSTMKLQLPSADDILEKNYPNKGKLLQAISELLNLTSFLYDKALIGENFQQVEQSYKTQINELEASYKRKLQKANSEIKKLNSEIDSLYLDSRNSLTRKQKGLKDNMIDLSSTRTKSLSKNIKDIEDEFSGLFD